MTANVKHRGANCVLTYKSGGYIGASLRCSKLTIDYQVNSEESHARQTRAFYPHRRSQGNFSMTFDFKGWREYRDAMNWFRAYATVVLNRNSTVPPPMTVLMPSRSFTRLGIPTTGVSYGDHIGSMVFSPSITFVSVSDPNDPTTNIVKTNSASTTHEVAGALSTVYFYPDSVVNSPGKLAQYLYGDTIGSTIGIGIGDTVKTTPPRPVKFE